MCFRQLPAEILKKYKDIINAPTNLAIIPTPLHAQVIYHFRLSSRSLIKRCNLEMCIGDAISRAEEESSQLVF